MWQVKVNNVAGKMNRWGSYDSNEIIRAAEEVGYTEIEETDDTITGIDPQGWETVIAEE
ncbi:MAG: hypothetical protein J5858_08075 [Lentisphaeria bacterium]|nr:hypothetical protein [Lentisphaeria bacterium]